MQDDPQTLGEFGGVARLFPLPNVVLFPHVVQPLHIFEPRYRQMTTDALTSDRLIAMALLKPGWETEYEGRPETHPIGCLGHIVAEQRQPDGKYNLLLRGLCRLRLGNDVPDTNLYRSVRGELLPDARQEDLPSLRKLILSACQSWLTPHQVILDQIRSLFAGKQPIGSLCDILAFALPLSAELKQELLEALDVEQRARQLLHILKTVKPPERTTSPKPGFYPPEFSAN